MGAGVPLAVAVVAYLTLYYRALKHRRNVKLHAGYMLATPLILLRLLFSVNPSFAAAIFS